MIGFLPVSILVVFRIRDNNLELFMQKRVEDGPLDGLLEFPGGKVKGDETAEVAALREFSEEVEVISGTCHKFKFYKYDYPDRSVCLFVNIMRVEDKEFCKGSWVQLPREFSNEFWQGKVPDGNLEILKDLTYYLYKTYGGII